MPIKKSTLNKYMSPCFVETGSYLGDSIQAALDAGCTKVISIELAQKFYDHCVSRFKGDPRVTIVFGDSADVLWDAIKDVDTKITFWLDGHWSAGETAYGKYNSPLIQEFEQISRHPIKDHIILVDDMRCWREEDPEIKFGESQIRAAISSINPKYSFSFEDGHIENDILVATII